MSHQTLQQLPNELLSIIYDFLDAPSVRAVRATCKNLYAVERRKVTFCPSDEGVVSAGEGLPLKPIQWINIKIPFPFSDGITCESLCHVLSGCSGVQELTLSGCRATRGKLERAALLPELTRLRVEMARLKEKEDIEALALFTRLTRLTASSNIIGQNSGLFLPKMEKLTRLGLATCFLGDEGVAHLSHLTGLTSLDLGYNQIGQLGALHLIKLTNLTELNIGSNDIGSVGVEVVSRMRGLINLNLEFNHLQTGDVDRLGRLTKLASLSLRYCGIDDGKAAALSNMESLTRLNLKDNSITDKGALWLAGGLTNLTHLNMCDNKVEDTGGRALLDLPKIKRLKLMGNPMKPMYR